MSARSLRWLMQGGGYNPLALPNLLFFNSYRTATPTGVLSRDAASGATRTVRFSTQWRCSVSLGADFSAWSGGTLTLSNYANGGNNGAWPIIGGDAVEAQYTNASAVAETVGAGIGTQVAALSGYCNSYTDLFAGRVFTQATVAQCPAINTDYVPGKRVLGIASALSRHLGITSTGLAGQLNGTGDFTLITYMRPGAVNVSATTSAWMSFQDAAGTSRIRARYTTATAHTLEIVDSGGNTTTISATLTGGLVLNTWQLLAVVYSGGTATWYLNGVAVGTNSGTVRTRAALADVFLGYRSSYPGGTGGTGGHRAVDAAMARAMTAQELLALTAWCQGQYA